MGLAGAGLGGGASWCRIRGWGWMVHDKGVGLGGA